jgi:hypothetical protein
VTVPIETIGGAMRAAVLTLVAMRWASLRNQWIAVRSLAWRLLSPRLARELLCLEALVPGFLCVFELLARIAMVAARAPVAATVLALRVAASCAIRLAAIAAPRSIEGTVAIGARAGFLRRRPQLAPREPFHLRVGLLFLQPRECWQQLFAFGGAERRGKPPGDDGPVRESRRHVAIVLLPHALQLFDERRALDAQQLRGAVPVASGSIQRARDQILLDT